MWSPSGDWMAFCSDRPAPINLFRKATSGAAHEERLTQKSRIQYSTDWSPDGRHLLYEEHDPDTRWDLWVLPVSSDRKPEPFVQTPSNEMQGQFSPDGRLVAYVSDETNRNEVYVQTFPASAHRWQVSTGGGSQPRWRRDGRELFYARLDKPWWRWQ